MNDERVKDLEIDKEKKESSKNNDNENIEDKSWFVVEEEKKKKKLKKRRLKKGVIQTIFCLLSLIFIIGCFIYYGGRLIKYYKIYNPKTESGEVGVLLTNSIAQNSEIVFEGEGLYRNSGVYIYKGASVQNYIEYSGLLWRIVRSNPDGSLEIILDDYINILAWDFEGKEYIDSDIHAYLNDVFVKYLNMDLLVKTTICTDKMESIDSYSCNNKNMDYYVKLLPANDFLNSVVDNNTFISSGDDLVWLGTTAVEEYAWLANGSSISTSEDNNTYFIKPVVTLKNYTQLLGGTGSKDDPYIIEKESKGVKLGSYMTIGEDTWIVYEKNDDTIKLVYSDLYNNGATYRYDVEKLDFDPESDYSLAKLLNTNFYESLPYKDLLLDFDVYTGTYDGTYKNMYEEKVTVKVGVPSALDLKFNNEANGYYLSTKSPRTKIYYYKEDLISSSPKIVRVYRPTISIKIPKVSDGNGTVDNPFKVEVE